MFADLPQRAGAPEPGAAGHAGEPPRWLTTERAPVPAELTVAETELTRLTVLAGLSELLNTQDVESGLDRIAALSVEHGLADWCVIDRLEEGTVTRSALVVAAERAEDVHEHLRPLPPLTPASTGSLATVLSGAAERLTLDLTRQDTGGRDRLDDAQAELFRVFGGSHASVIGLRARGRVLGAMTWVRLDDNAGFSSADELMARLFGLRIGQWLDNLRLHDLQRRAGLVLQRSLLTPVPETGQLQIVARYVPCGEGVEVGGDWYDALVTPGGETVLAIGDVTGHDMTAAGRMAQLRSMLRFAALDTPRRPSEVLRRLDLAMPALDIAGQASAITATVTEPDPSCRAPAGAKSVVWTNAGHPPPLMVEPDGTTRLLERHPDLLLGVLPDARRADHHLLLTPGCTLLLYTDGLVERRGEHIDEGFDRLLAAAARFADKSLPEFCDAVLAELTGGADISDDIALVAARLGPAQPAGS